MFIFLSSGAALAVSLSVLPCPPRGADSHGSDGGEEGGHCGGAQDASPNIAHGECWLNFSIT